MCELQREIYLKADVRSYQSICDEAVDVAASAIRLMLDYLLRAESNNIIDLVDIVE